MDELIKQIYFIQLATHAIDEFCVIADRITNDTFLKHIELAENMNREQVHVYSIVEGLKKRKRDKNVYRNQI